MARAAAANGSSQPTRAVRSIAVPTSGTALLLIDVINDLAFNGSQALIALIAGPAEAPLAKRE